MAAVQVAASKCKHKDVWLTRSWNQCTFGTVQSVSTQDHSIYYTSTDKPASVPVTVQI